jgi:hypothetical protein
MSMPTTRPPGARRARADRQQAAAGADVEHALAAAPGNLVEQAVAVAELAPQRVAEHQQALDREHRAGGHRGGEQRAPAGGGAVRERRRRGRRPAAGQKTGDHAGASMP